MSDNEVKQIHAHREANGKLEYLVEWKKEGSEGQWKLLKEYSKHRELVEYWQNILEAGARSLEEEIALANRPYELPMIDDSSSTVTSDSNDGLPKIITSEDKGTEKVKTQPNEVKVKNIFGKLVVRDAPHVLCEMNDGKFNWIKITSLHGNKLLERFYFIEHILKAVVPQERTIDSYLQDSGSSGERPESPSSSSTEKSLPGEIAEEISHGEEFESSIPPPYTNSSGSLVCEVCNKSFSRPQEWNDHIRNHTRFECFWCRKDYNWRSLPAHALTKHKKKGRCCVCGVVEKFPARCKNRCLGTKGKLATSEPMIHF